MSKYLHDAIHVARVAQISEPVPHDELILEQLLRFLLLDQLCFLLHRNLRLDLLDLLHLLIRLSILLGSFTRVNFDFIRRGVLLLVFGVSLYAVWYWIGWFEFCL